ncbi:MAG: ABC transporter ATP-binding protein [Candidatus Altarchaeum sp.]|nr:ABC transporter ATP-binding protein [Candidatus Altarchaeum sp.]
MLAIRIENLQKIFNKGKKNQFSAIKGINLSIDENEFVALMGPSGCGKSTLLNLISTIDSPTEGKIYIYDKEISKMSDNEKATLRRKIFGFVFQQFNLINSLTVLENITMPMLLEGLNIRKAEERAKFLIKQVELEGKENNKISEISGGQMQRVAIARALANNPKIILADEPTGNLDSKSGMQIMEILKDLNKSGITLIIVTHDLNIANTAKKIIKIKDGEIC